MLFAKFILEKCGDRLRYVEKSGNRFLVWGGLYWEIVSSDDLQFQSKVFGRVILPMFETIKKYKEALNGTSSETDSIILDDAEDDFATQINGKGIKGLDSQLSSYVTALI